jgi:hypothetical protein
MRYLITVALVATTSYTTFAQSIDNALRFSILQPGSTARVTGVSGAFTALGADFGAISSNPAGLAMYRTDEFTVTPGFRLAASEASFGDNPATSDESTRFHLAQIGFVSNRNNDNENARWRSVNFAIGLNQLANFRGSSYAEGASNGTILNGWYEQAVAAGDPSQFDPFTSRLAYDANAIYFQDNALSYDFLNNPQANIQRAQNLNTFGQVNELTAAMAGNYEDRIFIGGAIGVPFVRYRQEAAYTETDPGSSVDFFDELSYSDYVRVRGYGVNAKLGVTLRLSQALRLGVSYQTPTFMSLTDNYGGDMTYTYTDGTGTATTESMTPEGEFKYRLRTPGRINFGGALLAGKNGFISADVEWVNYANSRFNLTDGESNTANQAFERELNQQISDQYRSVLNYRLGGEFAKDIFRLRGGVSLNGKPNDNATGFNLGWSVGAGLRGKSTYLELAYRRTTATNSITPWGGADAPVINSDATYGDVMITIGFRI